jgi:HPt (histidine-containing phosphotransfer) domain-containing protein
MLIFNKVGKLLACTDDTLLQPLGYESVKEFFNAHNDISEIFIQKEGYVASYDNIPWIALVYNDVLSQKNVLVSIGGEEKAFAVSCKKIFSQTDDSYSVTFAAVSKIAATPTSAALDEDEELLALLASEPEQPQTTQPQAEDIKTDQNDALESLEDFTLDFNDNEPNTQEQPQNEQAPEPEPEQDDDLYDFNLDLEQDEQKEEQPAKEDVPAIDDDELLDLLGDSNKAEQPDQTVEEDTLDLGLDESQTAQEEQPFTQYIDSDEHMQAKEVDLESLANELGLEKEECANFIHDFAHMVQAKEDALHGEHAAIEATSLKSIAENFRLFNIAKTLESIENGEANATLLFSQVDKLLKELSPYATTVTMPTSGGVKWNDAQKQAVEFDPNVAAESLGLPTELINEFVIDFVEQAQESKDIFEKSYNEGNLKEIQETAHKLKGAASNLRIEPLASKLEELQHNNEIDDVPQLLVEFWGMYLGLKEAVQ